MLELETLRSTFGKLGRGDVCYIYSVLLTRLLFLIVSDVLLVLHEVCNHVDW